MILFLTVDNTNLLENSKLLTKEGVLSSFKNNPFAKYIIYIKDNTVIGYIYYSDIYERCEINNIEVALEYRNSGIGTKMMDFFIKNVDKNVTLEVKKDNTNAIKLYKKFDFTEVAIRRGYYNGVDGILMERVV